ncbi:MAG: aminotransferase class IV [Candidatus Eiseniibacteriota bacterium]|nr:MAG: aminotransferase class IV [Candidatus Eisenbacteria bacterium]
MADRKVISGAVRTLEEVGAKARVFISMPAIKGITPRVLLNHPASERATTRAPLARVHGIFAIDEIGVSCIDHAPLYGDACFEGIIIRNGIVFLYKEHMDRLWKSAEGLRIEIPYSKQELSWHVVRTIQATGFKKKETGYIRLVVTRGIGDLGLNPNKCVGATVYAIVSTITLFPKEAYRRGIALGLSRKIRRPGSSTLDPRVKSNNYLNNLLGLLEGTNNLQLFECLMLTAEGNIAEGTVDNIFCVVKEKGYRTRPSKVRILTPVGDYCLNGLTRASIMTFAARMGYKVEEVPDLMPIDLLGPGRECFMAGTAAGIMPVVEVCGNPVGDGTPGEVTKKLLGEIEQAMADRRYGLSSAATKSEVYRYIKSSKSPIRI